MYSVIGLPTQLQPKFGIINGSIERRDWA